MCKFCEKIFNDDELAVLDGGIVDEHIRRHSDGTFSLRLFLRCTVAVLRNISFCPKCGRELWIENWWEK